MVDSFMFFTDKSLNITNRNGSIGLIIPDVILYQKDNENLRKKILKNSNLTHVLNVGDGIFENVARPSAIVIACKRTNHKDTKVGNFDTRYNKDLLAIPLEKVPQTLFNSLPNTIFATKEIKGYALLNKLSNTKLEAVLDNDGIQRGISPDLKDAFIVDSSTANLKKLEINKIHRTVTGGVDVKRFYILNNDKKILYISKSDEPKKIPNIISHISNFRDDITCKEVKQDKHPFYTLHRARNERIFSKSEKILGVITGDKIITSVDCELIYPTDGIYLFSSNSKIVKNKAVSVILNSKLVTYLYRLISSETNRTMAQIKPVLLSELPFVVSKSEFK